MTSYLAATTENLSVDLTEKPMWILSSYGPGKNPPCQLIDGKDVSFEEARVMAYQCQEEGNFVVYVCLGPCLDIVQELTRAIPRSKNGCNSILRPKIR
jgi:hypothetical protein